MFVPVTRSLLNEKNHGTSDCSYLVVPVLLVMCRDPTNRCSSH